MAFKCGIIGTGIMGKAGAKILQLLDDVEVTALADLSEKNLGEAAAELGVEATYTPLPGHAGARRSWTRSTWPPPTSITAARASTRWRPAATSSWRSRWPPSRRTPRRSAGWPRRTGKKFQVNFNHRWLSPYHKIKAMIDDGQLGEPVIGYARKNNPILVPTSMLASWAKDSSPAWFMSSHDIDLMVWWFGAKPVEVYARGIKRVLKARGMDTYDGIQSLVTFDGGQFATFEAAWIYPNTSPYMPDSFMEVIGTGGHHPHRPPGGSHRRHPGGEIHLPAHLPQLQGLRPVGRRHALLACAPSSTPARTTPTPS